MKITIIGTGAYSLSIALMLAKKKNNNIMLWTENKEKMEEFNKTRQIKSIFSDVFFPHNILVTDKMDEALLNTNLIFLITSVKYLHEVCLNMKAYYQGTPICIASKGIDSTLTPLSIMVKDVLKTNNICAISGPTFAIDLINNEPVALAIAGNKKCVRLVMNNLANETLKLRKSSDIVGIELCGSVKNVFAIASGILHGLGYHESTTAFLINESLHDMKKIIHALGGKKKTILSFAGIGDLLLTCTSSKSRNYSFGVLIGSTNDKEKINEYLKNNTVEGYYTLNSLYEMTKKKRIDVPLISILYDITHGTLDAKELVTFLINKP